MKEITLSTGKVFAIEPLTVRQTRTLTEANRENGGIDSALSFVVPSLCNAKPDSFTIDTLQDAVSVGELLELQEAVVKLSGLTMGEAKAAV